MALSNASKPINGIGLKGLVEYDMDLRRRSKIVQVTFYFFTWLLTTTVAHAQYPNLKFENLDTAEGLSSSTCTEIFQDSEGFLWFGTIDGLNKYDGYGFQIFRPILNDPNSISNNRITSITEDEKGNLWIGTSNGLNVFDKETQKFFRIDLFNDSSTSLSSSVVINDLLYNGPNRELWVATKNGIVKVFLGNVDSVSYEGLTFAYYLNSEDDIKSLDDNDVVSISRDNENTLWVGTNGNYLNRYNKNENNFDRIGINIPDPFTLTHLPKNVLIDNTGNFWIGNDLSGLVFWNRKTNLFKKLEVVDKHIPIFHIYQDKKGLIWIATDGNGIYILNQSGVLLQHIEHSQTNPFSLPNDQPSKILEDKDGIFWIASYNKGISKATPSQSSFGHYFYQAGKKLGLSTKIAQSVLQDSKKRIWIGADGGGLNLFNEERNSFTYFRADPLDPNSISSDKILYLLQSYDGSIWICTWDGGLSRFDPKTKKAKNFKHDSGNPDSIGQNTIWCATEDAEHRLWLGTQTAGLNVRDPVTGRFYKYLNIPGNPNSLPSNFVFSLFIDSKDRLLVGTSLGLCVVGLDKLEDFIPEKISFQRLVHKSLRGNRINYITEDSHNNIWLGTDMGLYKMDSGLKLLQSYTTQEGLPNNLILAIQEDNRGSIWITSKSGLSRLNPKTQSVTNYNVHDGVQGMEFQSKSIEITQDGRIIVGGINGFNVFDPNKVSADPDSISTKISEIKLFNKEIRVGDTINGRVILQRNVHSTKAIDLKYDEGYVTIDFVALYYQNPDRIKYAYRMVGLDNEFVETGSNRIANYSSLLPGEYTFEVKASLDGSWDNAQIASVDINILPPPWKTWWAYLLYTVFFLGILWFGIQYYANIVREEKEHELDQMKLRFIVNVSHEFRTPLTLILNPIDNILSSVNDSSPIKSSALTIQRSARRLLHLVNQLLDYRKMDVGMSPLQLEKADMVNFCEDIFSLFKGLANKKEITYRFNSEADDITMIFDLDKVEKIITNLISNAIKFTDDGGRITVFMKQISQKEKIYDSLLFTRERLGDYVEIVVEDTGNGLNKDQVKSIFTRFYNFDLTKSGTGIGLNLTKALVEMHGGEIFVESQPKIGSRFVVRLPLNLKRQPETVKNIKNEFRLNSIKAVEYDMMITDRESDPIPKIDTKEREAFPSILIVEDNKELRTHLTNDLKSTYNVKEAANGEKGLKSAKKYYPDIIISDVMMPKMDGFELCRRIKTEFETSHIPVLLLTAKSQDDDRVTGYHSGADAYLAKPFVTKVLKARISNLLDAKMRLRQRFSEVGGIFPSSEVTSNNIDEAFLDKATKIVLDNINDMDFKQEHLLKDMGVGRSQLYRKISSLTGNNPSYFIRTIRLRHASELLLKNQHSIKEVSYMTGFNSTAYFSKTFKELFKLTPTEFMEQKGPADVSLKE